MTSTLWGHHGDRLVNHFPFDCVRVKPIQKCRRLSLTCSAFETTFAFCHCPRCKPISAFSSPPLVEIPSQLQTKAATVSGKLVLASATCLGTRATIVPASWALTNKYIAISTHGLSKGVLVTLSCKSTIEEFRQLHLSNSWVAWCDPVWQSTLIFIAFRQIAEVAKVLGAVFPPALQVIPSTPYPAQRKELSSSEPSLHFPLFFLFTVNSLPPSSKSDHKI